jgi:hypothetical protein
MSTPAPEEAVGSRLPASAHGRAFPEGGAEAVSDTQTNDDDDVGSRTPLPPADSTTRRATIAWWTVFLGPAALTAALSVGGAVSGRDSLLWIFTLGVWAFTLTLGLAASPRERALWWLAPLVASFVAAGLAIGLMFLLDTTADRMSTTT